MKTWTHKEAIEFHTTLKDAHLERLDFAECEPETPGAVRGWLLGTGDNRWMAPRNPDEVYGVEVPNKEDWPPQSWHWDYELKDFVVLP